MTIQPSTDIETLHDALGHLGPAAECTRNHGVSADNVGRPMLCQDRPIVMRESRRDQCRGAVDFREPLSGTGVPTIRCAGHWAARLELQARHRRDYPDSATPPGWYTAQGGEAYAGERWDEDD